jgi:hypothetical protein
MREEDSGSQEVARIMPKIRPIAQMSSPKCGLPIRERAKETKREGGEFEKRSLIAILIFRKLSCASIQCI